jgi:hypothetical protein
MNRSSLRIIAAATMLAGIAACAHGGLSSVTPPPAKASVVAPASSAAACPACTADPTRYLRQLSLDLRGRPPSLDELEEVEKRGEVSAQAIDAMLASDEFVAQVEHWHKALLWPNIDGFRVRAQPLVGADFDEKTGRQIGGTFSPDPTLVDDGPPPKGVAAAKRKPPHGFVFYGDNNVSRLLRGSDRGLGCDPTLEYPQPAATGQKQPTYKVVGSDKKPRTYAYYDDDGVPLPYHDAAHCPNFCSSTTPEERAKKEYRQKREYYAPMNAKGADKDPHELDPAGMHCPDSHPYRMVNACTNAIVPNDPENFFRERREGYRKAKHYWAGATELRTCAYEAQTRTSSVRNGASCAGATLRDPSCGCGPNGVYCMPSVAFNSGIASRAEYLVRSALNEEPLRIVGSVVERDEDYFDIFRTRRSFVNGALAFLYKNQLAAVQGLELSAPAPPDALPDVPYADTSMHEIVRNPEHAGVLTTPAWLGRFPTWRSRISQFRSAFMCRPFTPATASLPSPDDACTREPNLARRCGCKNCHTAIEPMTAWFGRWAERSAKYLAPDEFPSFDPYCQQCALTGQGCTPRCRQQYVTSTVDADGARYAGTLRGYLYRTKEEEKRIDEGPQGLVSSAIASGELESCAVRNAWSRLLGRPMSENEMNAVLPDLVVAFADKHHSYRALVRAIVTSAAYRRID